MIVSLQVDAQSTFFDTAQWQEIKMRIGSRSIVALGEDATALNQSTRQNPFLLIFSGRKWDSGQLHLKAHSPKVSSRS